jgi:hypothetical protein
MPDLTLELFIALLSAIPFVILYWVARYLARRRQAEAFRRERPWQEPTLRRWAERGWLVPERLPLFPPALSPPAVPLEWAITDPEVAQGWSLRESLHPEVPVEALLDDLWRGLAPAKQQQSTRLLRRSLAEAVQPWAGAEAGWNHRPLVLPADKLGKQRDPLPVAALDDLTAAPGPGPITPEAAEDGRGAEGPDLVLMLFAARRSAPQYLYPLAVKEGGKQTLISQLSRRVGTDMGRQLGARVGSALGPIGMIVGGYLGGMAGTLGGNAVANQALPAEVSGAAQMATGALQKLGALVEAPEFPRSAAQPEERIRGVGAALDAARQDRNRRFRERIWPTASLALLEETQREALGEFQRYRAAQALLVRVARKADPAVAGGILLQNPWLVRLIPEGPARLTMARNTLNRAVVALRRLATR